MPQTYFQEMPSNYQDLINFVSVQLQKLLLSYNLVQVEQSMFTLCCTGEHLLPKIGKENKLPTSATAQITPAIANFFVFVFIIIIYSFEFNLETTIFNDASKNI